MAATRQNTGTQATSSGIIQGEQGAELASAATITITDAIHSVTGSATITTINGGTAQALYRLIPAAGATWRLGTGGNIAHEVAATAGIPIDLMLDGATWRVTGGSPSAPLLLLTNTGDHTSAGMVAGMRSPTTLSISDGSSATPSSTAQPQITISRVTEQDFTDGIGQVVLHGTKAGGTGGNETLSVYARQSAAVESGEGIVGIYTRMVSDQAGSGQSHFATVDSSQKFTANVDVSTTELNINNLTAQDSSPLYSIAGDRSVVAGIVSDGSARNTVGAYINGASTTGNYFTGLDLGTLVVGNGYYVHLVTVTGGGTGYTSAPTVTFTGSATVAATATATIAAGAVTAVTLVLRGRGYTAAPTVGFTGGGGSGATATAEVRDFVAIRSRVAAPSLETAAGQWLQWRPSTNVGPNYNVLRALTDGNTILNTVSVIGFYVGGAQKAIMDGNGWFGVGVTSGSPATTLDVNGSVSTRRVNVVFANGANSDMAIGAVAFLKITGPTAAFNITGFAGGVNGRHLWVYNSSSGTLTWTHDATSTAANRIVTLTGADVVMAAGPCSAHLIYDSEQSRWVLMSTQD